MALGGGGGGVVQNRESPDFRSREVGRYDYGSCSCSLFSVKFVTFVMVCNLGSFFPVCCSDVAFSWNPLNFLGIPLFQNPQFFRIAFSS